MKYHIISFYVIEKVVSNPIIICNILGNMLLFSENTKNTRSNLLHLQIRENIYYLVGNFDE